MKNPFLIGDKIYLRGLCRGDLEGSHIQWMNDNEVCKYNSHHTFPYCIDDAESYIKNISNDKSAIKLAVVLKEDDLHIGNISLQNINYINRNAELAILLGEKDYWGKGYSKEATLLLIKHGFMAMNLYRVYCATSSNNIPMQKLAIYLGMTEEGRRREAMFKNGKHIDIVEYGILRDEFINKFNELNR